MWEGKPLMQFDRVVPDAHTAALLVWQWYRGKGVEKAKYWRGPIFACADGEGYIVCTFYGENVPILDANPLEIPERIDAKTGRYY